MAVKKKKSTRFPLWCGDVLDKLAKIEDDTYDGCLCDPPYGLSKDPDMAEVLRHWLDRDDYKHSGGGFMGAKWDSFVPGPSTWEEVYRVLKPGSYALVFCGTRTIELMGVSMRLAGFLHVDTCTYLFGSGFPKSSSIDAAVDKKKGAKRRPVGENPNARPAHKKGGRAFDKSVGKDESPDMTVTAPGSEEAARWEGYGTALKPAAEFVLVCKKPNDGNFAENALTHGVAGLNIDGCRISAGGEKLGGGAETSTNPSQKGNKGWTRPWMENDNARKEHAERVRQNVEKAEKEGRWPANVLLEHDARCEYIGKSRTKTGKGTAGGRRKGGNAYGKFKGNDEPEPVGYADEEGKETVDEWNCHDECPVKMLDEQSGRATPKPGRKGQRGGSGFGFFDDDKSAKKEGVWPSDPGGGASRFFYTSKANKRERTCNNTVENNHPTLKPLDLCEYLAKLILPPERENGRRRIIVPFCGSGSELAGALLAGWDAGLGIDAEQEYIDIARKRIEYVRKHGKP